MATAEMRPTSTAELRWRDGGPLEEKHITTLCQDGVLVVDNFLTPKELRSAKGEADRLLAAKKLQHSMQVNAGRTDQYIFLTPDKGPEIGCPMLGGIVAKLRAAAAQLDNRTSYAKEGDERQIVPLRVPEKGMIAAYDGNGARYKAHRDNACESDVVLQSKSSLEKNARYLTLIVYLNRGWEMEWGGNFRCHFVTTCENTVGCPESCKGVGCHKDIMPVGGRLCIFFSQHLLHEVMPTHRRRWAVSLWVDDARIPEDDPKQVMQDFVKALVEGSDGKGEEGLLKILEAARARAKVKANGSYPNVSGNGSPPEVGLSH